MKIIFNVFCVVIFLSFVVNGQVILDSKIAKTKLIRVPKEQGVFSLIDCESCGVKIKNAELFVYPDGNVTVPDFIIQNKSGKSITYVEVETIEKSFFFRNGYARTSSDNLKFGNKTVKGGVFLKDNESFQQISPEKIEIVQVNNDAKDSFMDANELPKLKILVFGLITKITYSDGTIYENRIVAENLMDLLFFHLELESSDSTSKK